MADPRNGSPWLPSSSWRCATITLPAAASVTGRGFSAGVRTRSHVGARSIRLRRACLRPRPLLLCVLELRQRLDGVLAGPRQDELPVVLKPDLLHGNGHVVSTDPRKAARADDGEGDRTVRRH